MSKVSIIMPVFNAEKYLAEAISSIIDQTFNDWELLIINDGSTDSSKSIIEAQTDKRIRYVENETNLGLIATLNKGISLCNSQYIARMDSDDAAHPERLNCQVRFLDKNEDYLMCGTSAIVVDEKGNRSGSIVNPTRNEDLQISLFFTNPFIHPSMMIRRSALRNLRFDQAALHVEDFELWTRIAEKGKVANLSYPLLNYRWHNANVSSSNATIQESSKNEIIRKQLEKLDIKASDADLKVHRLTFNLYTLGHATKVKADNINAIREWFKVLIKKNKNKHLFRSSDLEAFLWSRWFVLCFSQNKIIKAFFPKFVSLNPLTVYKTLKLIVYLSKK